MTRKFFSPLDLFAFNPYIPYHDDLLLVMQNIDILVTYTDANGAVRTRSINSKDLSTSWIWRYPSDEDGDHEKSSKVCTYPSVLKLPRFLHLVVLNGYDTLKQ